MSGVTGYLLSLLLLLAVVAAALALAWRRRPGLPPGGENSLVLAECEGRRYLLGQNRQGLSLLDRLPDSPPSFDAVAAHLGRPAP